MTAQKSVIHQSNNAALRYLTQRGIVRLIMTGLGLLACFWGIWNSGREGLAQMLASYGSTTNQVEVLQQAVRIGPTVPETHYAHASLLFNQGELAASLPEYERAVALRPHDFALWLELGRARDQADDVEGAIAAFKESARRAPFYAQPRWQLGNTLYRMGRLDEAFAELRRAADSNPKLLPPTLDLAWAATSGEAQAVERLMRPQTDAARLALARFFARHGKASEAIAQFRAAVNVSQEERRNLLTELLAAKRFAEAYEVWASGHHEDAEKSSTGKAVVLNGGFESPVKLNDPGFGWQLPQDLAAVQASQDRATPRTGTQSLLLVWNGNSAVGSPIISQLVLVEPNTQYQLRFAARTEKLVTAGLPQILVTDASRIDQQALATPLTLPQGTTEWQDYVVEFTTASETNAVQVSLRRGGCSNYPCPIFGHVWLDDFSIGKS